MIHHRTDVVVVGGGIIGLATADALQSRLPGVGVTVLEKEPEVAAIDLAVTVEVLRALLALAPRAQHEPEVTTVDLTVVVEVGGTRRRVTARRRD